MTEAAKTNESIFASADYFKDVKPEEVQQTVEEGVVQAATKVDQLLFVDANDTLGATMSYMAKDLDNLVTGVSTYGISEMLCYYETVLWDLWMFFAETQGMGWGVGIFTASLVSRALFAPLMVYSVSHPPEKSPFRDV